MILTINGTNTFKIMLEERYFFSHIQLFSFLLSFPVSSSCQFNKLDVASQTVPTYKRKKELSGSCIIISSSSKTHSAKCRSGPDSSVTSGRSPGLESQCTHDSPIGFFPSSLIHISESEESDCSSPSPIIFLDEVGYQKSLLAKLDIPHVPGGSREQVEDSDSEVSEFFDSFDQFDDLDEINLKTNTYNLPLEDISIPYAQKKTPSTSGSESKYISRGCSTKSMNPHRFDQPTLPANVKKPTPLKPGSPYSLHSEMPDSPRLVLTPSEENGGALFSPVSSSAFSPLVDSSRILEYFWKQDENGENNTELRKPLNLCSLYKTYSDFANSLSKEILESVCGYQYAIDISDNKNLSCVCQKEFKNSSGYLMRLSEIQETVKVAELHKKSQSLKDSIQRFATDLVEMTLGCALRDIQKGLSSCSTILCHFAAKITSSVFQMAFHEIGMRHVYVLKEHAMNGLASFLVREAMSAALKEFLKMKKKIFHNTVTCFADDLAEELVFEGIMEVCQFSHHSIPLISTNYPFGQRHKEEEEVVSSYASDLSESVIQEAFIELSQANFAFTSQVAISVSLDNIYYFSAKKSNSHSFSDFANQKAVIDRPDVAVSGPSGLNYTGRVKKALFNVSGMTSYIPVPQAAQILTHLQESENYHYKLNMSGTPQATPKRVKGSSSDSCTSAQTYLHSHIPETPVPRGEHSQGMFSFHNFSGNMVDMILNEVCELSKRVRSQRDTEQEIVNETPNHSSKQGNGTNISRYDCRYSECVEDYLSGQATDHYISQLKFLTDVQCQRDMSCQLDVTWQAETHPVMRDAVDVVGGQNKISDSGDDSVPSLSQKSGETSGTLSTPQKRNKISKVKQIKQFSKNLKSKIILAKNISPDTPLPSPYALPKASRGPKETREADNTDCMFRLVRSLSEGAGGKENEQKELAQDEDKGVSGINRYIETRSCLHELMKRCTCRMTNKEALNYAERLACHIMSMAAEMSTLGIEEEEDDMKSTEKTGGDITQSSGHTLNTLWVYAGEVAGEVIRHVKQMVSSSQQCLHHRALRSFDRSECLHYCNHHSQSGFDKCRDWRVGKLAEQFSKNLVASDLQYPISNSGTISNCTSGLSSRYPSCESVTDEYAGYLIRVLKKEGGNRELVLDQYASHLAYHSIKQGLAHASLKMKQRSSSTHLHSSCREPSSTKNRFESVACSSSKDAQCSCQSLREYTDLLNFAESLAYNITCDVTHKLHLCSVHLPKSLTDSCLYKKSKLEDMTGNLIRHSSSCPLMSKESKSKHYHSTESLHDSDYRSRAIQIIKHYASKIVDDSLKMSLPSHSSHNHQETQISHKHQAMSEGILPGQARDERTRNICLVQECPYCNKLKKTSHQPVLQMRKKGMEYQARAEQVSSLEVPKIHIDQNHRAAFAEEMVTIAMETAKRELSNTSLNADSGIGHDGASYADSLPAETMTSALYNICQASNVRYMNYYMTHDCSSFCLFFHILSVYVICTQ